MIYELAVADGAFLAKHNSKGFCSMAEEMEVRRRQEEEKREEGVMLMEDIKRKELAKSVEERRREIAEEQAQLKKEEALALSRMRTSSEGLGEQGRKKTCSVSSENVPSVEVLLNISGQKVVVLQGALMGTNSLDQVRRFDAKFCRCKTRFRQHMQHSAPPQASCWPCQPGGWPNAQRCCRGQWSRNLLVWLDCPPIPTLCLVLDLVGNKRENKQMFI